MDEEIPRFDAEVIIRTEYPTDIRLYRLGKEYARFWADDDGVFHFKGDPDEAAKVLVEKVEELWYKHREALKAPGELTQLSQQMGDYNNE